MPETTRFALIIALTSAVALAAVLVNRVSARLRVPAPVWMLVAAAIAVQVVPGMPGHATRRSSGQSQLRSS